MNEWKSPSPGELTRAVHRMMLDGMTNAEIAAACRVKFPGSKTTAKSVGSMRYRARQTPSVPRSPVRRRVQKPERASLRLVV